MKKWLSAVLGCMLVIAALSACGSSGGGETAPAGSGNSSEVKPVTMIVASTRNEKTDVEWLAFLDRIKEKTDGKIDYEYYPSGQLFPAGETIEALQDGRADMALMNLNNFEAQLPMNSFVVSAPFMGMSGKTTDVYMDLFNETPELQKEYEDLGIHMLSYVMTPPFNIHLNSSKDVMTPADLAGMKIIGSSTLMMEYIKELGAAPVQVAFPDFFTSLQGGVAEGITLGAGPIEQQGITDVINQSLIFGADSGIYYDVSAFVLSKSFWDSLTPEVQKIFTEEAKELHTKDQQIRFETIDSVKKTSLEKNINYKELTEEQIAPWAEAAKPVVQAKVDEIAGKPGCENFPDILKKAEELINAVK